MDFENGAPPSYDQLTDYNYDKNFGEKNQQIPGIIPFAGGNFTDPGVQPGMVYTGHVSQSHHFFLNLIEFAIFEEKFTDYRMQSGFDQSKSEIFSNYKTSKKMFISKNVNLKKNY